MKFGSVCSGIEAASVASHHLGWEAAWLSEIEPFPCAVLEYHYAVDNVGDMTKIVKYLDLDVIEAPEIFVGGTPCQAFSVAGHRKGLEDARGNLTLTFCEIADTIDEKRIENGLPPSVIVWENVPGVLSDKTNAFGCFLAELAGEDSELLPPRGKWSSVGCVFGVKRTVAWRVFDAQYFGVAQRRRRVWVVASARDDFDPCEILFEFDGVRRDIKPSRETRESFATPFREGSFGQYVEGEVGTTKASGGVLGGGSETFLVQPAYPIIADVTPKITEEYAGALRSQGGGGIVPPSVAHGMQVRRLTPIECESLQGFPDNYTRIPWRKKDAEHCPDAGRYKALGNSWAVPNARWIFERIDNALSR